MCEALRDSEPDPEGLGEGERVPVEEDVRVARCVRVSEVLGLGPLRVAVVAVGVPVAERLKLSVGPVELGLGVKAAVRVAVALAVHDAVIDQERDRETDAVERVGDRLAVPVLVTERVGADAVADAVALGDGDAETVAEGVRVRVERVAVGEGLAALQVAVRLGRKDGDVDRLRDALAVAVEGLRDGVALCEAVGAVGVYEAVGTPVKVGDRDDVGDGSVSEGLTLGEGDPLGLGLRSRVVVGLALELREWVGVPLGAEVTEGECETLVEAVVTDWDWVAVGGEGEGVRDTRSDVLALADAVLEGVKVEGVSRDCDAEKERDGVVVAVADTLGCVAEGLQVPLKVPVLEADGLPDRDIDGESVPDRE